MSINIEKSTISFIIRKLAHFTEFFILGCLARKSTIDLKDNRLLPLIFLVPIMDEFIQSFVPDRAMSVVDMGIDSMGIITGVVLISFFHTLITRKLIKND
jgi:VanZ family protein